MMSIRLRELSQLEYGDPKDFLRRLRQFELEVVASNTPDQIANLRTNMLKPMREMREAAIFCFGMTSRIGCEVFFAASEAQDYDFVATWFDGETQHFTPVQIKEVVPNHLNNTTSVQQVVDGLVKYGDSKDLTVAIHLNREVRFEPKDIKIPEKLHVGGLWVFGGVSRDQSDWALWGDFLCSDVDEVYGTTFAYPI